MTELQYLLMKLAEESGEVTQMACKTQQFGLDEVKRGQLLTNKQRLHEELVDVLAIVALLNKHTKFDFKLDKERYKHKQATVKKAMGEYMKGGALVDVFVLICILVPLIGILGHQWLL